MHGSHQQVQPNGGYRQTASFQTATLIHDATVWFCEKFLDDRSRTADQMVQASRSGRQNLAKGCRTSAASPRTGLRLMTFARASLEELLLDYEDYLRHRRLPQWAPDSPEADAVRAVATRLRPDRSEVVAPVERSETEHHALYARWLDHADAAVRANAVICLINQANSLLDRQIGALEAALAEDGGGSGPPGTERQRPRQPERPESGGRADRTNPPPACPKCGAPMAVRTAKGGKSPGSQFWGCTSYPNCKGTLPV